MRTGKRKLKLLQFSTRKVKRWPGVEIMKTGKRKLGF
jgi:hypothetical protein